MISKILIATDGSETALKASRYAIDLAKQIGASIIVLSVIDNRSLTGYLTAPPEVTTVHIVEPVEDFLREAAKKDVAKVKKLCEKKGVLCREVISTGHPSEEIIEEAERSYHSGFAWEEGAGRCIPWKCAYGVVHKETHIPVLIVRRGEKNR